MGKPRGHGAIDSGRSSFSEVPLSMAVLGINHPRTGPTVHRAIMPFTGFRRPQRTQSVADPPHRFQCHQAMAGCWRVSVGLFAHPLAGPVDNFDRFLPTCVRTSPEKDDQSLSCLRCTGVQSRAHHSGTLAGRKTCWVGPFRSQYVDHCPLGGTTVVSKF